MRCARNLPLVAALAATVFSSQPALADRYRPDGRYSAAVPAPASILGFEPGDRPARYQEVVHFAETIASSSPRVRLVRYAKSHEGRDLLLLIIASETNLKRLEAIRDDVGKIAEPRNSIVTLLVTVLMLAPVNPPTRTSNGERDTWSSANASYGTGSAYDCPPGAGSKSQYGLLKYDPSTEMLLYSQLRPAKLMLPSLRGSSRVRSRVLRLIDGVVATLSWLTVIDAPVRPALRSASFSAVTVTP